MPLQKFLLLVDEKLNKNVFEKQCQLNHLEPNNTVFLFPGNVGHHHHHTLYSIKSGAGLATVAEELGAAHYPTLSLPIVGLAGVNDIAKQAIADLWRAIGFSMSLALPVRNREKDETYFDHGIDNENKFEPKFWGGVNRDPDQLLAQYYLQELIHIKNFIEATHKQEAFSKLTEFPDLKAFKDAFDEGVHAKRMLEEQKTVSPWFS
jgi:hypothetical protein